MLLSTLLSDSGCPYTVLSVFRDGNVTALTYDSRTAAADTAFVCLSGARVDGHDFAVLAYDSGCRIFFAEHSLALPADAVVIGFSDTRAALPHLSDAFFSHPQRELTIIGVTGTKGKSIVANLIGTVLNACGRKTGVIGTIGITYNGQWFPTVNSTPESYILHKTFREMADAGVRYVVMEVSSQALFQHRVDGIIYDTAIFTNLSKDHIGEGEHPTFAHYKASKMRLFSQCGFAVLNADDAAFPEFRAACTAPFVTYGLEEADYTIRDITPWGTETCMGIGYTLCCAEEQHPISLRIPGIFNAANASAAIAVLRHLGLSYDEILPPLARATVPGRVEILDVLPFCTVMIDYAHNGLSMTNLLSTVRAYHPRRIICLYGSVGGRTRGRRQELGTITADMADYCIITTDNPDFEPPEQIIAEIAQYYTQDSCPHVEIVDRREAILYALHMAKPGDVLLFCGKGHETYQIINGIHVPFSEKEIIITECARMREELPQKAKTLQS